MPLWEISLKAPPEIITIGMGQLLPGKKMQSLHSSGRAWVLLLFAGEVEALVNHENFVLGTGTAVLMAPLHEAFYSVKKPTEYFFVTMHLELDSANVRMPAFRCLNELFSKIYRKAREAVGFWDQSPHRAEARLWDILWELSMIEECVCREASNVHSGILVALESMESRMSDALTVSALAAEAGLSKSHFTRLFKDAMNCSPERYLCLTRVYRAEQLLRHSLLSIKSIAATVGMPDLHLFNKVLHRELGHSPRHFREFSVTGDSPPSPTEALG